MSTRITHWIGGKPFGGTAERVGSVYDPATGRVSAEVDFASGAVVDQAVAVAKAAFEEWRHVSLTRRTQIMLWQQSDDVCTYHDVTDQFRPSRVGIALYA